MPAKGGSASDGKLTLTEVKNNPQIINFIEQTEKYLNAIGYTDHGFGHLDIVVERAIQIAKSIGLSQRQVELSAIAAFCHDLGNFLGRTQHHYWAAMLFSQVFLGQLPPEELSTIIQAIVSHDKNELKLVNKVSAVLILADKSDVHRNRVIAGQRGHFQEDIHDRVNYASTWNKLAINRRKKQIILKIKIDAQVAEPIDYFEIFIDRMTFCRHAAKFLGYKFVLIINNFKLS